MQAMHLESMALRTSLLMSGALLSAQPVASLELGRNQSGALVATLTDKSLHVQGVSPGGEVAYLGASHEEVRESWGSLQTFAGILTDQDLNGEVEVAPAPGISQASVWVAIDLTSGDALSVSPNKFVRQLPEAIELQVSPDSRVIATERQDLEFLLYRPGQGAWFGKGLDGGQGDNSLHADGRIEVNLSVFRALRGGGPPAPSALRPGDRLIAIDLNHLDAVSVDFQ